VFSLQNKVVANVAQALELRLVSGEPTAPISGGTSIAAIMRPISKG